MPLNRLKTLLSVPSYFLQEEPMISFLLDRLSEMDGVRFWHDMYGNVFAVKGQSDIYPLVCAHTDTVHRIEPYNVEEFESPQGSALRAKNLLGKPTGIGGDNKTGVFTCLELLREREILKAGFFMGEEMGFHGAVLADERFFHDVGWAMEFDAPEDYWISKSVNGTKLYDEDSPFYQLCWQILERFSGGRVDTEYGGHHPYTDVFALKSFYDFSCLNFSSGYYNMHSDDEYVVPAHVFKAVRTATELLDALGCIKYPYVSNSLERLPLLSQRLRRSHYFVKYKDVNIEQHYQ